MKELNCGRDKGNHCLSRRKYHILNFKQGIHVRGAGPCIFFICIAFLYHCMYILIC